MADALAVDARSSAALQTEIPVSSKGLHATVKRAERQTGRPADRPPRC